MKKIKFKGYKCEYGFLSNFYYSLFIINNIEYSTVEQFFQSEKCINEEDRNLILESKTPYDARKYGKLIDIRDDWDLVKDFIMFIGVNEKFKQNPKLRSMLLNTSNSYIVEDAKWDSYWGVGIDGKGFNKLGNIIMIVRSKIIYENGGTY